MLDIVQLKHIISTLAEAKVPTHTIAAAVQITEEEVITIILHNGYRKTAIKKPGTYPTSFYIARLRQGKKVKEIADELGCSSRAILQQLNQRGISKYTYYTLDGEDISI